LEVDLLQRIVINSLLSGEPCTRYNGDEGTFKIITECDFTKNLISNRRVLKAYKRFWKGKDAVTCCAIDGPAKLTPETVCKSFGRKPVAPGDRILGGTNADVGGLFEL